MYIASILPYSTIALGSKLLVAEATRSLGPPHSRWYGPQDQVTSKLQNQGKAKKSTLQSQQALYAS